MDTQPPPQGKSRSNTGRLLGTTSYTEILGTQQERRHKLVHHDAANVVTKHMTQDAYLLNPPQDWKQQKQEAVCS
jgi:hypothetical protein